MARSLKVIPKNIVEVVQAQITPYINGQGKPISDTVFSENRGTDYSFKNDTVKDVSVGLEDIDAAVMYYFENIIKPTVIQNGQRIAVPVIYGSPERWKSVQADGFYRDNSGRLMVPLIMFKRENIEKNRTLGNKLDGNKAHLYQVMGTRYNNRNEYNKFSIVNNRIPSEQFYITAVPDYITLGYSCIIFTDFVEQNNKLVEAIEFTSDSYWGDPKRWKFKAKIDTFTTTTLLEEGTDRAAKSSFNITLNGYIIPDTVNKDLAVARSKFYTTSQVVFGLEVIDSMGMITNTGATTNSTTNIDEVTFANKPSAANSAKATSFIGGGINVSIFNDSIANADLYYLSTSNIFTSSLNTLNVATFVSRSIIQPASGSSLPPTSINNFTFYINGQYVPPTVTTLNVTGSNININFNTSSLGYTLEIDDEVVGIGKWI